MSFAQVLSHRLGRSASMLVLEDNKELSGDLVGYLSEEGWQVDQAFTVAEASSKLRKNVFDLVLADYFLPDDNVLGLFRVVRNRSPLTKILVMTGVREPEMPVQAFRHGAADFVYKPFTIEQLEKQIQGLLEVRQEGFSPRIEETATEPFDQYGMVGQSLVMRKVLTLIERVADTDATVLITGESGTGKELVARALHEQGSRRRHSMVTLNCAAIPEGLLEAELFGHVPGAFTDARGSRAGRFEQANKGTLFLDEIGEMPPSLQVKLLRVLESREACRLGTNKRIRLDARVIAATNADLRHKIEMGAFRQDLFYRLNLVQIHLPPLRERKEDTTVLARHFVEKAASHFGLGEKNISERAMEVLMSHSWPGNVRELRNLMDVAVLLSGESPVIETSDLANSDGPGIFDDDSKADSRKLTIPDEGIDLSELLMDVERDLILKALERSRGNKRRAAQILRLKRTTLVAKLRRLKLADSEHGGNSA